MPEAPPRGTRPRNRRQLILAAAAELFARDGYAHVSMTDLAEVVSVRPSALYGHFRGKEDLLYQVVDHELSAILASLEDEGPNLAALVESTLDHRHTGTLWQRESRHLDPELRALLRGKLLEIHRRIGLIVVDRRPALSTAQSNFLAWALADALMSISFQRIELPRIEYEQLLVDICEDVMGARLPFAAAQPEVSPEAESDRTRRDQLLTVAARLFAERGFRTVGVDDVGAAAGITGPSVYKHFDSKVDLLVTLMLDGARQLEQQTAAARRATTTENDALNALVGSYAEYAFRNHDVVDVLITETAHLPEQERTAVRAAQRSYVAQWTRVQRQLHQDMPQAHALVRLQAFLSVTNDIARTPHLRAARGALDTVRAIGQSILKVDPSAGTTGS